MYTTRAQGVESNGLKLGNTASRVSTMMMDFKTRAQKRECRMSLVEERWNFKHKTVFDAQNVL